MQAERGRSPTPGGVIAALVGLALFVYFLQRAGVSDVVDGIRRIGMAFVVVVALGGLRFAIRSAAWMRCLDGPHRLTLSEVFQAVVVGDSLGNLTGPLSLVVGEPAKGIFLRHREPLRRTLPALAVEHLFYTLSAVLVITGGLVAVFLLFQTSGQLWITTAAAVAAMVALVGSVHWIIWNHKPIGSSTLRWLGGVGVAPHAMEQFATKVRHVEDRIHTLYPRDRARLVPLALLEFSFHALAVLEIYLILSVISDQPPTLLHAFVLESTNRFISFAFRFVPLRIGVDEAGTGMFADLLAFGTAAGVTLAIIRKGRILVWIAVGVVMLVRRGLSLNQILGASPTGDAGVVVVIMARSPEAGDPPKTRLARAVASTSDRRRLYGAFLKDTVAACRTLEDTELRIAHTPDGGAEGFADLGVLEHELIPQRGSDLGTREASVFTDLFDAGFSKVVVLGSDLPTFPIEYVRTAVDRVDPGTVVLGPSEDGGYYLMALETNDTEAAVPNLFSDISWSTSSVLDDTMNAARRAGLRVELVEPWYDVDDEVGLAKLREELRDDRGRARAPSTAQVLEEIKSPAFPTSPYAS